MAKTREQFSTPVGRLVQGDCFEPQTKDQQGNPRVIKSGPNVGQPAPQYFVAVAFPKVDPANPAVANQAFGEFYALLDRVARAEWPALFPTPGQGSVNPLFTMKVKDGDGIDRNGKSNATKEGFAGHWIVSFASAYAPKVVRPKVANPVNPEDWETLTKDMPGPKRGHFVRIAGSATGNDSPNTPGLYVNLDMIEWAAIGPEIVSGPDAAGAFGGGAGALPQGAQALPVYAANPTQAAFAQAGPAAVVPAVPAIPATPAAPVGPQMTALAQGKPYADFIAGGWTDALLIEHGYMTAPAAVPAIPAVPGVPAVPGAPVTPYAGYMAGPGVPATPLAVGPAATPSVPATPGVPTVPSPANAMTISPSRQMTAKAGGQPKEVFIAAGWTEELLISEGYMTP